MERGIFKTPTGWYYIELSGGYHSVNEYRLYFSKEYGISDDNQYIRFPIKGMIETAKGGRMGKDFMIKKSDNNYIYI